LDAMVAANDTTLQRHLFSAGELDAPSAIYRPPLKLKDGFLAASIGLSFAKTMRAIGRADLIDDKRFCTPTLQRENMAVFVEITKAWAADKTLAEVAKVFDEHDIPYGKVASSAEVLSNPTLAARQMIVEVDLPGVGPTPVLNTPFNFSGVKCGPAGPPPRLGEHTREVLTELLDLSEEHYARLLTSGAIRETTEGAGR